MAHGNLMLSPNGEKVYLAHYLPEYFDEVISPLAKVVGGDYADKMTYGQLDYGFLSLGDLTPSQLKHAFDLTLQACKKNKNLVKYKEALTKAFHADPRFESEPA